MIKYKIPTDFKVKTHSSIDDLNEATEYQKGSILSITEPSGISHSKQIFDLWSIAQLSALGISKIDDPLFVESQFDLTGTPTDTLQVDKSYLRDYAGALTEKAGYIDTLRGIRSSECSSSYNSKIEEGYDCTALVIKVNCDTESVRSFKESADNIANGNSYALKIKDYGGLINDTATAAQITSISDELTNYKGKLLDKKFEHLKTIETATRAVLDLMTSFDWTI